MSEFDRAELSALLDGELEPARARKVEALVATDPLLSAEFEQLKRADRRLRALAKNSAFAPRISLQMRAAPTFPWLAVCLAFVVAAWASSKVAPAMILSLEINATALVLFIACLMSLAVHEERAEPALIA